MKNFGRQEDMTLLSALARCGSLPFAGQAMGVPFAAIRPRFVAEAELVMKIRRLARPDRARVETVDPYQDVL